MLNRIHIRGYKSLGDLEIRLSPLTALFGPNAAGKSNLLDALQLLSRLGTCRTLGDAFLPPHRGNPLESFAFGDRGIRGQIERESLALSFEADLRLSDTVIETANRQILEMRRSGGMTKSSSAEGLTGPARERNLRYRIEVEMLTGSGILRVRDEYLAALNARGEPTGARKPFIDRQGERIRLRREGRAHSSDYPRGLGHSVLSMPHYPPHCPHIVAARRELEGWSFFYFEPRERTRTATPIKEMRAIGRMGEGLAGFLKTLQTLEPRRFEAVEKALCTIVPDADGIELEVSDLGEVELWLRENGAALPARVASEGTLRILGLLVLTGAAESAFPGRFRGAGERRSSRTNRAHRDSAEYAQDIGGDPIHRHHAFSDPA